MDTSEVQEFLKDLEYRNKSPNTIRAYRKHLKKFLKWADKNDIDVLKMSFKEAREFRNDLCDEGTAPASINAILSVVNSFFNFLCEEEKMSANPMLPRKLRVPEPERGPDYMDDRELSVLFTYMKNNFPEHVVLAFRTMLDTGLRVSEAASLKPEDVVVLQGKVFLKVEHGKGNRKRTAPVMNLSLAKDLIVKSRQEKGKPSLFGVKGETLRFYAFTAKKNTGIDFHSHRLRHTAATKMLSKGISIDVVQTVLGHSDIRMTRRYASTLPESLFKIAADINIHS